MFGFLQGLNPFTKPEDPAILQRQRYNEFAALGEKHVAALAELASAMGTAAGHARTVAAIEPKVKEAAVMAGIPAEMIFPASDAKNAATWAVGQAHSFATLAEAAKSTYGRLAAAMLRRTPEITKEPK